MTAKVIYLDSSDYSNIASAVGDDPFPAREQWLKARDRVLALRDADAATFRFAYPIVSEAYPPSPDHRKEGLARAIMDICGPRCLLDLRALWTEEAIAVAKSGVRLERAAAWRDDGASHPDPDGWMGEVWKECANPQMAQAMLREETPLNRAQRRAQARRALTAQGTLTRAWAAALQPGTRAEMNAAVAARLGLVPSEGDDVLVRVMFGELPRAAATERMSAALRDLNVLFALDDAWEARGTVFYWIRDLGRAVAAAMGEMRLSLADFVVRHGAGMVAAHASFLESRSGLWAARLRNRLIEQVRIQSAGHLRAARVRERDWARVVGSVPGSLPSLDTLVAAVRAHVLRAFQNLHQLIKPKEGDGPDLLHLAYMPYVDVIRCDRATAETARAVAKASGLCMFVADTMGDALEAASG